LRPLLAVALLLAFILPGCSKANDEAGGDTGSATAAPLRTVVVFTALDRVYSEPILKAFEQKTGIRVDPVYDAESAKTTGLVNRLLARRDDPECDVLWNNEVVQTVTLAEQGVLTPYRSPSADRIPAQFRDPNDRWTGFAARLRVFIYNTHAFPNTPPPSDLSVFTDPRYRGRGAIALPYYGTTFTHVALLHYQWGPHRLRTWLDAVKANDTAIAPGNGAVKDLVASGERDFGLTDTDDARGAILDGKPVAVLLPDPAEGAILIPNTVALIRNAPHADAARQLIDYLLSPGVERQLATMRGAQVPLGTDLPDVGTPWNDLLRDHPPRDLPLADIARSRTALIDLLRNTGLGQ
jgi:iron(III) transport system substrate-binding protein